MDKAPFLSVLAVGNGDFPLLCLIRQGNHLWQQTSKEKETTKKIENQNNTTKHHQINKEKGTNSANIHTTKFATIVATSTYINHQPQGTSAIVATNSHNRKAQETTQLLALAIQTHHLNLQEIQGLHVATDLKSVANSEILRDNGLTI